MPFLFLVIFEIFLFAYFSEEYGFLRTLGAYWIPTFLMLVLLPYFLSVARSLSNLVPGSTGLQLPKQLHKALLMIGLFLLAIPLVSSRIVGILLVLPGLRHLLIWKFHNTVQKKTHQYFGQWGQQGTRFYYRQQSFETDGSFYNNSSVSEMKDVTPRDIRIERKDSSSNENPNHT